MSTKVRAGLVIPVLAIPLGAILCFGGRSARRFNAGLVVSDVAIEDTLAQRKLLGRVWRSPEWRAARPFKGVVLVSHGFSGDAGSLRRYAAHLAHNGYVVAALTHPDIPGLRIGGAVNDPLVARPRHLRLLREHLRSATDVSGVESMPVGLLGYSLGAYAVLAGAGFPTALERQAEWCASGEINKDPLLCSPRFEERIEAILDRDLAPRDADVAADVHAVAILAPGYLALMDLDAHRAPPPVFVASGELDEFVSAEQVRGLAREHSFVREHIELEGAGHYVYLERCPWPFGHLFEICKDPAPIERAPLQTLLADALLAFFDRQLSPIESVPRPE